jgi:futalosine hydrolase
MHLTHDVLFLAAFDPELGQLRQGGVSTRAVGVGLPAAAVGTTLALQQLSPGIVVLVGTCGAYPGAGLAIGDAVVAKSILLVEPASVSPLARFCELPAPPMRVRAETNAALAEAFAESGARPVDVATTLGVTVDDHAAQEIALATGARAEHLEAFGVALACEALGVPLAVVLGVANEVGSRAREQWRAHHHEASAAAARVALHWLGRGAPGRSVDPGGGEG